MTETLEKEDCSFVADISSHKLKAKHGFSSPVIVDN